MLSNVFINSNRTIFPRFLSLLVFELEGVVTLTTPTGPRRAEVNGSATQAQVNRRGAHHSVKHSYTRNAKQADRLMTKTQTRPYAGRGSGS